MLRGARTTSKVFARGALIGAAEWLLMAVAGAVFASKSAATAIEHAPKDASGAAAAGAAIGGGLVTIITGGVSIGMAIVCLLVFAVAHFWGREMRPEAGADTKKCPQCAELVKSEAARCRFCGHHFGPGQATAKVAGQ
jgi:hypothetical protein